MNPTVCLRVLRATCWVTILLLWAAVPKIFGQPPGCPLSLSVSYDRGLEQLSIADVDFEHFKSRSLLYTLFLRNDGPVVARAKLNLTIEIDLADRTLRDKEVLDETSDYFEIPPGGSTITNLDLNNPPLTRTDIPRFSTFTISSEVKKTVQDVVLATGKFPAGTYTFRFRLVDTPCGVDLPADQPIIIVIRTPSRIELRAPRDGELTDEFPLFEFFLDDALRSTLTIAEVKSGQSVEDALDNRPPMLECQLTSGENTYSYGQPLTGCSASRPLEEGKTYAWRVTGRVRAPGGGEVLVQSPIWRFVVSRSPRALVDDALLRQLEEILGHRYAAVFQQIRRGGFRLTGRFSLDGSTLTATELVDVLNRLRSQRDIIEVTFE